MSFTFKPLNNFEHQLKEKLMRLDAEYQAKEKVKLLFNLQISGGMDSMCLLNSIAKISNSKYFKPKNDFIFIAQHFNHHKRGLESELDEQFVKLNCLKNGISIYIESLKLFTNSSNLSNFQEFARNWRKEKALELCEVLSKQYDIKKYFVVTAHHARDHAETVLMHLIRGCGLDGLVGITEFDEEEVYYRPFYNFSYNSIVKYCEDEKIDFRVDSSNLSDKYERNYIRLHVLPHLSFLNNSYEKSFNAMSCHLQSAIKSLQSIQNMQHISKDRQLETFSDKEIYAYLIQKNKLLKKVLTQNAVMNILHEIRLFKKSKILQKDINLAQGWIVQLNKVSNNIDIEVVRKILFK